MIGSVDERITVSTLEAGYAIACALSLQTNDVKELKGSIALPTGKQRRSTKVDPQKVLTVDKTGDITKPQHPEFSSKLIKLLGAVDLLDRIKDPDIFQQAAGLEDPISFLRQKKRMLDDPLNDLY